MSFFGFKKKKILLIYRILAPCCFSFPNNTFAMLTIEFVWNVPGHISLEWSGCLKHGNRIFCIGKSIRNVIIFLSNQFIDKRKEVVRYISSECICNHRCDRKSARSYNEHISRIRVGPTIYFTMSNICNPHFVSPFFRPWRRGLFAGVCALCKWKHFFELK